MSDLPDSRRPTMAQVARAAGVSVMSVSYAYGRPERVSSQTRQRVRDAAAELGYPGPHPGARSLRRGRAGSLGVVLGEHLTYAFDDPQAARFLAGVAEVCGETGLGLTLLPITGTPEDARRVGDAAVDGFVVWTTTDDDPVLDAVLATGLPTVVHGGPAREGLGVVTIDDRAAATAIGAAAFAEARRPAVLSFPLDRAREPGIHRGPRPELAAFPVTRHRLEGLRHSWQELGGEWADVQVVVCARNDAEQARVAAVEMLSGPDAPDAVAAMSDELAFGVLRAAADLGLRVPGDLAVSGWDDTDQAAGLGLTTIAQSLREQGRRCARQVMGHDDAEDAPEWELLRRASTGAELRPSSSSRSAKRSSGVSAADGATSAAGSPPRRPRGRTASPPPPR